MNSSCQVFYSYSSRNIQNIERKMPFPKHIFICMNTNATGRPGRATFRQSRGKVPAKKKNGTKRKADQKACPMGVWDKDVHFWTHGLLQIQNSYG